MAGFIHADQRAGAIDLVLNPAAATDPTACRWSMPLERVIGVEVLASVVSRKTGSFLSAQGTVRE